MPSTPVGLRKGSTLDVRFRVCDASRDVLEAELRVASRLVTKALASTHGGCVPFRVLIAERRAHVAVRLRVRDDAGLWSRVARVTVR